MADIPFKKREGTRKRWKKRKNMRSEKEGMKEEGGSSMYTGLIKVLLVHHAFFSTSSTCNVLFLFLFLCNLNNINIHLTGLSKPVSNAPHDKSIPFKAKVPLSLQMPQSRYNNGQLMVP